MSAGTMIDPAARAARAMRLEDVLINASAVPIPIDLMPSAIEGPIADGIADPAAALPVDAGAHADQNRTAQAAAPGDHAIEHSGEAGHGGAAPDAITNGLQAAREAIHASLRQDEGFNASSDANSHAGDATSSADGDIVSSAGQVAASAHGAASVLDTASADGAATTDPLHGIGAGGPSALDIVAQAAHAIADQSPILSNSDQPGLASALAVPEMVLKPVLDTISSLLTPDTDNQHAGVTTSDVLTPATTITQVAATIADVASSAVGAATTVVDHAAGDLVHGLSQQIVHDVVAPAVATLGGTVADTAVTVASLGGAGVDALAGLLQPASLATQAPNLAADAVHTSLQDISSFAPIGIEHVADHDAGAAHAVHSALHLVGSGLI
jgi:hypothetical protein